ncbi:MAG: hypothetical protein R1F54_02530 [Candidatus Zeuxoniibacter abyssi]|nr:MAG: hypothetical protein R1F54_02530 [Candidatus Persebacteraceae bacterium AB1(2)]
MNEEKIREMQFEQLRQAAKIFLRPMDLLPFPVVVEAMTDCRVLPAVNYRTLLRALAVSCVATVKESQKNPIRKNRPNDVSSPVENILEEKMKINGLQIELFERRREGYPDRFLRSGDDPACLEVKVSREENINQGSPLNFFYQPVANSKIRCSAPHLLAGFAIREVKEKEWVLTQWTIVNLFFLRVQLKPEYNAANPEIYRPEAILLKGNGSHITEGEERLER